MIKQLLRYIEFLFCWAVRLLAKVTEWVARLVGAVWSWGVLHLAVYTATFLVTLTSLLTRTRMSHDNGIATRGKIRMLDQENYPKNAFFKPGDDIACRCRFAMVSFSDDARFVARGASLKFADTRNKSPLDLLMNTGLTTPFNSVRTFWGFMLLTMKGRSANAIRYMQSDPKLYVGSLDPLRRNPETFAQLYYHSKIPYTFELEDKTRHYVKFRMIPWDKGAETGLPGADDQLDWAWCWQGIRPGEQRNRNYLKQELVERLGSGPIRFHLQMQLHAVQEGERREVIDSGLVWDEATHPWLDLAEVQIDEVLDHVETNESLFTIRNRPSCMGVLKARNIDDPAGMNYLRELAIWPRRARILANRLRGVPKPFPDKREPGKTPLSPFPSPVHIGEPEALSLPQKDTPSRGAARRQVLSKTAELYPLTVPGTMPTYLDLQPEVEQFDKAEKSRMFTDIEGTASQLGLSSIEGFDGGPRVLATYEKYYPFHRPPDVHERWDLDAEFARQRLNGVNPTMIKRCVGIPSNFPVTDEILEGLLSKGTTLEEEVQAGRVYLTDYLILDKIKTADTCYLAAPICLFHVESDGTLLPWAIQLCQDPANGPIFTPKDPPNLWLAVKMYVQSADASYHEIYAHLLRTHLVAEPIYLCARRNLSARHPLMELLAPHFKDTLAINHAARTSMVVPGGALPRTLAPGYDGTMQLMSKAFRQYRFDRFELFQDLKARGIADRPNGGRDLLPNYFYRDDAVAIHDELSTWVGEVLRVFYLADADVQDDLELRAWLTELGDPKRGNLPGLPYRGQLSTIQELVQLVTQILFTSTAEHSAVNNGQYDYFGYIPNAPGALHKAPPTCKKEISLDWIVEAMPDTKTSAIQIAMVHLLSSPANWPLGNNPEGFFQGHRDVLEATKRFHARLDRLSFKIRSRNALLAVPYTYLDPRRVSKSIVI